MGKRKSSPKLSHLHRQVMPVAPCTRPWRMSGPCQVLSDCESLASAAITCGLPLLQPSTCPDPRAQQIHRPPLPSPCLLFLKKDILFSKHRGPGLFPAIVWSSNISRQTPSIAIPSNARAHRSPCGRVNPGPGSAGWLPRREKLIWRDLALTSRILKTHLNSWL